MAENFNPNNEKRQAWALSELKETYIEIFQLFIKARIAFTNALNGSDDPVRTKIEYIAALDAYYQVSQAPLESYLKSMYPEKWETIVETFDNIAINGFDKDNIELHQLGNYINKWNTRDGFMRLNDSVIEFTDPFDKIKFIEDNK